MDHLEKIVDIALNLNYEDIPSEAILASKKDILDTLGCILAGTDAEGTKELFEVISDWGGKEESTVLYHGLKVPAPYAALINGTLAHARDFDDTHDEGIVHAGISIIPSALAAAEIAGDCDGKTLLKAITIGLDLMCRLGKAATIGPTQIGLVYTSTFAYFGSALTAGLILKLNKEQLINAIGITLSQVAGTVQAVTDAALTKRIQPSFGAQAGVMAAILAKKGITGAKNVFDGQYSFPKVYLNNQFNYDVFFDSYGSYFESSNLGFKPYPCCRFTHPSIDATLQIRQENELNFKDIEEIIVNVGPQANVVCEPVERRKKPQVVVDAQFSIPYTVAVALQKGKVFVDDFTPEAISDKEVLSLAAKVTTRYDEDLGTMGISPAIVMIRMKNGQIYSKRVDYPLGSIENSMSFIDIVEKFKKCASLTPYKMDVNSMNEVIARVEGLESVKNAIEICNLLIMDPALVKN